MKFLIASKSGESSRLAFKLKHEGHDVDYLGFGSKNLLGIINHVQSFQEAINLKPDIAIFDSSVDILKPDEVMKSYGIGFIGPNDWASRLEKDERFAIKAMDSFGIRAPRSYCFDTLQMAIEFVSDQNETFSFRMPSSPSFDFSPKSYRELIDQMVHLKKDVGVEGKVVLDEIIYGHDVSVECWYSNGIPVPMPVAKFETNRLMNGDSGVRVDGQTSVAFAYPKRQPKLVQESLKKIAAFLERIQYTGPLCIHGTVKKNKFYGRYFTVSPGSTASFFRLLDEPVGEFFARIAKGDASAISFKPGFAYSMKITMPSFPEKASKNAVVDGIEPEELGNVYPEQIYMDHGKILTCGTSVMDVTGYGETVFEAERGAVNIYRYLQLPMKQARLGDGGKIALRRMEELGKNGYEMPPFLPPLVKSPPSVEALANVS